MRTTSDSLDWVGFVIKYNAVIGIVLITILALSGVAGFVGAFYIDDDTTFPITHFGMAAASIFITGVILLFLICGSLLLTMLTVFFMKEFRDLLKR